MDHQINLQECNRALIYGENGRPLSESRVLDTGSNIYLFLGNSRLRPAHIDVFVDFYNDPIGIYRCICGLDIRRNKQIGTPQEVWMAECQIQKVARTIQRRKYLRVQTNIPLLYANDEKTIAHGAIQNISPGGIRLDTSEVMKNGTILTYERVLDNVLCEEMVQIIYGRMVPGKYRYSYGCRYVGLSDQTARAVRSWCHSHQQRKFQVYA